MSGCQLLSYFDCESCGQNGFKKSTLKTEGRDSLNIPVCWREWKNEERR